MRLVILGLPGAGKGTVAAALSEAYDVPHIASGDLLREAIETQTPLGRQAGTYVDSGRLVPDDLVVAMMAERLAADDCRAGFLLDGFPRTVAQADALGVALAEQDARLEAVLYLEVDPEVVVERLSARRTCERCGRVYNLVTLRPRVEGVCDGCGGRLTVRLDDEPETVRRRIEVYRRQTLALVDYYEARGRLRRVDAGGTVEAVRQAAIEAVASLTA